MASEGEYWGGRRKRLNDQVERDERRLNAKLAKAYRAELRRLRREIADYYRRFGEADVIEYRTLLRQLSPEDVRDLMERMDEFAAKHPQWANLMPVRESIYRLNELEGIQRSIWMHLAEIGAMTQEELESHLREEARLAANDAAEAMGFGSDFYQVNSDVVEMTINARWADGKSFSDTIWENTDRLAAYLNDDFAKAIARGATYDECWRLLSTRFENVSRRNAQRLIYTEGTFVLNEAQARAFEGTFDEYYIEPVGDAKVCEVCRGMAAKSKASPFRYSERKPGVNFPPFHPWCRCSAVPTVADWDAWIDGES